MEVEPSQSKTLVSVVEPPILEKHRKYKTAYGENETFWGFGIELETYFQFKKPIHVATTILKTARARERYSVDYYPSYKPAALAKIHKIFPDASGCVPLPLFVNGHSFQKTDRNGHHVTTYEKVPKPNPRFSGKTILQEIQEFYPRVFLDKQEVYFTFDGDTVEFMTQDFYRAKVPSTIQELQTYKKEFLAALNEAFVAKKIYLDRGPLIYPPANPPFAVFATNPKNVLMFNSGTYHINITLPTELGPRTVEGYPTLLNPEEFKRQHRLVIRAYQWLEPILIAMYGTPDLIGSRASQRCAMSRYIGIGTYDTTTMPEGKILTVPIESVRGSKNLFWWHTVYHKTSAYSTLKEIGMDINYKKHFAHGIEFRIFDWFPESRLQELCELLIYVAEAALESKEISEPAMSKVWNRVVVKVLQGGQEAEFTMGELGVLEGILKGSLPQKQNSVKGVYGNLYKSLKQKYGRGKLANTFLHQRKGFFICC